MRTSPPAGFDIREAVDNLRDAFSSHTGRGGPRVRPHDLRASVLAALMHESMNGHQIMRAIAAKTTGEWMPAASEVYPLLLQLTDEGLLSTTIDDERTVYSLTEAGRDAAAAASEQSGTSDDPPAGWRLPGWDDAWARPDAAVPKAGAKLAQAAAQVAQHGTAEQKKRAAAILDDSRRAIYAILAEG